MSKEYSMAVQEQAEHLIVERGYTYRAVSEKLNIPTETIARWSRVGGWKSRRIEYQGAMNDFRHALRLGNIWCAFEDFLKRHKKIQVPKGVVFQSRRKEFFQQVKKISAIFRDHH